MLERKSQVGAAFIMMLLVTAAFSCTQAKTGAGGNAAQIGPLGPNGTSGPKLPELVAAESASGDMLVAIDPNTNSVITTSGSTKGSAAFKAVSLAIAAGSVAGSGTLSIAEAASIASPAIAATFGINKVSEASPTVIIAADSVTIVKPITIALPIKPGLSLAEGKLRVLALFDEDNHSVAQLLDQDKVRIEGGFILASIQRFGAYQAVTVSEDPVKTVVTTTIKPVKQSGGSEQFMPAAMYLLDASGLPPCSAATDGQLYYIANLRQFQTCNGSSWIVVDLTGPAGAASPDSFKYEGERTVTTSVVDGKLVTTTAIKQYDSYGGKLLRTCKSDNWSQPLGSNGSYSYWNNYGDPGCPVNQYRTLNCNISYMAIDGTCVPKCTDANFATSCNSELKCTGSGMTWSGGQCRGVCSSTNPGACTNSYACNSAYGMMWVNNSCVAKCSDSNLSACTDEPRCTASGMMWDNGATPNKCLGTCSTYNPIACGETACSGKGMTWASGKCLGQCMATNLAACNTLKLCQQKTSSTYSWTNFEPGYWVDDKQSCMKQCPDNTAITDTGCKPLALCSSDKTWDSDSNTCVSLTFTELDDGASISESLYNSPVLIKAGEHLVTTDATFSNVVRIAPGARLVASTPISTGSQYPVLRNLVFAKTLYAEGTSDNADTTGAPVIFSEKDSAGVTKGSWGTIQIKNAHDYRYNFVARPFTHKGNYKFGTKLENVIFEGVQGSLSLSGYATNLNLTGATVLTGNDYTSTGFNEPNIYLENSQIPVFERPSTGVSYLIGNTIKRFQQWGEVYSAFLWRNTIGDPSATSPVTTTFGSPAIVAFNTFLGNVSCSLSSNQGTKIFGNKIFGTTSIPLNTCRSEENSNTDVSEKTLLLVHDGSNIIWTPYFYSNSTTYVAIEALNKDLFDNESKVDSEISYTISKVEKKFQFDSRKYSFTAEAYTPTTIKILKVANSSDLADFMGMLTTTVGN